MSVSHFSEVYTPIVNGVVASIAGLHAGLRTRGIESLVVAPSFPTLRESESGVVRLPSLPLPAASGYRLCVPLIDRHARARIARAAIAHVHSPFVTGMLGVNIARRSGIPVVFTYHTRIDEYAHYAPLDPRTARSALITWTRSFANRTDAVIAPTAAMRDRLRALGVRVPIAVVASSIDVERFANATRSSAQRAQLGARDARALILAVARVAKEKQLELAIDALARAPQLQLAIVGDGPHRAALETRAAAIGVRDRVTFAGLRAPHDLPELYAAADAFVFTSETETQGLVLAEAMAAGVPVVAVDSAVNREMLGGCGRLVSPDPSALAGALERAAAGPRDAAAASAAVRRFTPSRQIQAVIDVYSSVSVCRPFGTPLRHHGARQSE